jgi:hypothetical protein
MDCSLAHLTHMPRSESIIILINSHSTGMGKGVDWWTLGVLMHELMSGHAPFEANDPMETYQKIVIYMIQVFKLRSSGRSP